MPRVKRGVIARARHKKVLNAAKGYRGRRQQRARGTILAARARSCAEPHLQPPHRRGGRSRHTAGTREARWR